MTIETESVVWRRLRLIEAVGSDRVKILALAEALRRIEAPSAGLRNSAALWLERLADNPKALARLTSKGRGRKRDSIGPHLALDYLVNRELQGARRWKRAKSFVAEAWGVEEKTVSDAWTDWKDSAEGRLAKLTQGRIGESRRGGAAWTRTTLLADISADLREIYGPKGRGK